MLLLDKKSNKRGQMTIFLIVIPVLLFLAVLFILVGGVVTVNLNNILSQDLEIGQVNLKNVSDDTFGQFTTMYLNNADWWGMSIIFGMIFGLFLSAYLMRGISPKYGIILDIFIIIITFILCLYVSSIYGTLLDSLATAGNNLDFLENYAPKTSMFMLNLHIFSVIIGVIVMFVFHSSIPRKTEERYMEGGYLQGAY